MNHLEQLVAEWYEYNGYFVRRNVKVGRRPEGGYECELDVIAFHPGSKKLVQIEPSTDTHSIAKREERYSKKFAAGKKYIPELFAGLELPQEIEQIALFIYGAQRSSIAGGKMLLMQDLMKEIMARLSTISFKSNAIPETYPMLRTLHLVSEYRAPIQTTWGTPAAT